MATSCKRLVKIDSVNNEGGREDSKLDLFLEITHILLPIVIVGGIAVFVVTRMKHKYKNDTLGKKKSKSNQILLDSFIPLGMLIGCAIALLISLFLPISLLSIIGLGAGIGLLFGYLAYEVYSKKRESN